MRGARLIRVVFVLKKIINNVIKINCLVRKKLVLFNHQATDSFLVNRKLVVKFQISVELFEEFTESFELKASWVF